MPPIQYASKLIIGRGRETSRAVVAMRTGSGASESPKSSTIPHTAETLPCWAVFFAELSNKDRLLTKLARLRLGESSVQPDEDAIVGWAPSRVKSPRRYRISRDLSAADLVVVPPASIPITTRGKLKRAQCVEL